MILIGAVIAIGFAIKKIIENIENAKKTLYAIGGLFLVAIVSYFMASDELLKTYENYNITSATSKKVGMGLNTFYILTFIAIATVLYTELTKVFTK